MRWQYPPYLVLLVIAAAASAMLARSAWRRRSARGALPLMWLMIAVAEWALGYALELSSADLPAITFWAKVEYLGIVTCPIAGLVVAFDYTGRDRWLTRRRLIALSIVPLITLLLVWTNEAHHLIWASTALNAGDTFVIFAPTYGPWFTIHTAYSYLALVFSLILLTQAVIRSPRLYRGQTLMVLGSWLVPLSGNAIYIFGLNPLVALDLTPFAFTLTGLLTAWSLFYYRMFDIAPVARDTLIERMSDAVIVLDRLNRIVDLNPAAQQIIRRTASQAIGQPADRALAARIDLIERYRDTTDARDEIVLGTEEEQRFYDLRISPLNDRHGTLTGRLIVLRDITDRKHVEEELYRAKEAAEAASRAKSVFLANMSHELRTPLTAVMGYSEVLQMMARQRENEDFVVLLTRIRAASSHLLLLISDILDLSKIEAGRLELFLETFDLSELVAGVVPMIQPLVERNGNTLAVHCPDTIGMMHADQTRVRQVLFNLLNNAAKFTEQGTIMLAVSREMVDGADWLHFRISDTGIGMSADQIALIFKEFSQADASTTRKYGGTGLGLALSRHFCQMMGGDVVVESRPGEGSCFIACIPAHVATDMAHTEELAAVPA